MPQPLTLSPTEAAVVSALGERVRRGRLERRLSQADAAEKAGMTRKTYQSIEAGSPGVGIGCIVKALAAVGDNDGLTGGIPAPGGDMPVPSPIPLPGQAAELDGRRAAMLARLADLLVRVNTDTGLARIERRIDVLFDIAETVADSPAPTGQ